MPLAVRPAKLRPVLAARATSDAPRNQQTTTSSAERLMQYLASRETERDTAHVERHRALSLKNTEPARRASTGQASRNPEFARKPVRKKIAVIRRAG